MYIFVVVVLVILFSLLLLCFLLSHTQFWALIFNPFAHHAQPPPHPPRAAELLTARCRMSPKKRGKLCVCIKRRVHYVQYWHCYIQLAYVCTCHSRKIYLRSGTYLHTFIWVCVYCVATVDAPFRVCLCKYNICYIYKYIYLRSYTPYNEFKFVNSHIYTHIHYKCVRFLAASSVHRRNICCQSCVVKGLLRSTLRRVAALYFYTYAGTLIWLQNEFRFMATKWGQKCGVTNIHK